MASQLLLGNNINLVKTEGGELADIEIKLSAAARHEFLDHFADKDYHWSSSSASYIVQNIIKESRAKHPELKNSKNGIGAKLETIKELSQQYAMLERHINQPDTTAAQLKLEVHRIALFILQLNHDTPTEMKNSLQQSLDHFEHQITELGESPSPQQLQQLFSAQDMSYKIKALGTLINEQYEILLTDSMQDIHTTINQPMAQALHTHPALIALSKAKRAIGIKNSLYGADHSNTHTPIPKSMLAATLATPSTLDEGMDRWFSLKPYIYNLSDAEEVDKILCYFSNDKYAPHAKIKWYYLPLKLLAILLELAVAIPLRTVISLLSFAISCVGRLLSFITRHRLQFSTANFDQKISKIHHNYSAIRYVKKLSKQRFQKYLEETKHPHQEILKECQKSTRNLYNDIFTHYFSGDKLASLLSHTLKRIIADIKNPVVESTYILSSSQKKRDENYTALNTEMQALLQEKLNAPSTQTPKATWPSVEKWQPNTHNSPLDAVTKLNYAFTDLINRMFCEAGVPATLFFMLSQASAAVLLAPASFAASLGPAGNVLHALPAWFSQHLAGIPVDQSLSSKLLGVFLEWEGLFFSSELISEIAQGDFEFLDELFRSPEEIILGAALFASLGYTLGLIPEIHSPAASVLNFLSDEARHCANASIPFGSLTRTIIGLKIFTITHSMLAGKTHHHEFSLNPAVKLEDETITHADQELRGALLLVMQMEMIGPPNSLRSSSKKARLLFDKLDDCIENYNKTVGTANIDKKEFLHNFYNKYCYRGSNNLLRIVSLAAYPVTVLWRISKFSVAATPWFHAPSIQHQVSKSFAKDKAIVLQLVASLCRSLYVITRAYAYSLRAIFLTTVIVATLTTVLWKENWRNNLFDASRKISPHRLNLTGFFRTKYAVYSHEADTNDHNLLPQCQKILLLTSLNPGSSPAHKVDISQINNQTHALA